MDTLRKDLAVALRGWRRQPAFAAVAIITLALGIGANTAVFSLVNAALIRSLPFERPESLVLLWGNVRRQAVERRGASYPDFLDWQARGRSFEGMAAYWDTTFTLYGGDGEPERLAGEVVSSSYFRLLGASPIFGRVFRDEEDRTGSDAVVLLGQGLWRRRFGADAGIVGRAVQLGSRQYTVVGVLPAGFHGLSDRSELWTSVGSDLEPADRSKRGDRWFPVLARLAPGVDVSTAQANVDQIARALAHEYPETNEQRGVEVAALRNELVGDIAPILQVALAAVGVVLLIACANVASLFVARAEARGREMAIRTALGASRARLTRQLVTEGVALTLVAAVFGVLLAYWLADALVAGSPVEVPRFVEPLIDRRVLLFTAMAASVVGLVIGLIPAWQAAGYRTFEALRDSAGRSTHGIRSVRVRQALVVAEMALALVLAVGASLLVRTFAALTAIDPGYVAPGALTLRVSLPELEAADEAATSDETSAARAAPSPSLSILERLQALPGVDRAGLGSDLPLSDSSAILYTPEGQPPTDARTVPRAYVHRVTPDYFAALGMRLVRGRAFRISDLGPEPHVVIVSEDVVKRYWPGQDPIGRRLKPGRPDANRPWLEVVGVVNDTKFRGLPRNPTEDPDLYFPFSPASRAFAIALRTRVEPASLLGAVRATVRNVEPRAVIFATSTLSDRVATELSRPRFAGWLMTVFGGLALLLAAVGVYGVTSQIVTRRTAEFGVRMALGATRRGIIGLVLGQGLRLFAAGVALGSLAGVFASRALEHQLYGVRPADPASFAAGILVLLGAGLLATWLPARRATQIDPLTALREE
jgi:putative ABC transport system permease protein